MMNASPARFPRLAHPLAFAMWDFSWLERRGPGAGYEDWSRALDELGERGYNALRIDPYPHLAGPDASPALLEPVWSVHDWGSAEPLQVNPLPALVEFLGLCRDREITVGLSTWFRKDAGDRRLRITSPEAHARLWCDLVSQLRAQDVLDAVCYVDLCNEFPGELWAPFFDNRPDSSWNCMSEKALQWMEAAVRSFRTAEPGIPVTVSVVGYNPSVRERWAFMDFLEPHIWMSQSSDFIERIGGNYNNFDLSGYEALAARGESTYRADPAHWQQLLRARIEGWAQIARACQRPIVTTECWAVVNYREGPGLDWGWIKELCEYGVTAALATGCWSGIATSNFCGPQFPGMWRDVAWHRRQTQLIKSARFALPGAPSPQAGASAPR
jgi:hypothetical protein